MGLIRRQIRLWTMVWALGQLAMVAALLPRECCAGHRSHRQAVHGHCGTPARGTQCPMRGADGTPCPMHRASGASECSIRGTCAMPVVALAVVLSQRGIPAASVTPPPNHGVAAAPTLPEPRFDLRSIPPDTPPPRA